MAREKSELAEKVVEVKLGPFRGEKYRVEDWWQNVSDGNKTWMESAMKGNFAAFNYLQRAVTPTLKDNDVLYGKIGHLGYLIHVSEL